MGTIDDEPGKQGSLAVCQYLARLTDVLDMEAANLGLALFAEHTAHACNRPGAHPNIDRLLDIAAAGDPLDHRVIAGGR